MQPMIGDGMIKDMRLAAIILFLLGTTLLQASEFAYPTHAIVPAETKCLLIDGVPLPLQLIPVGCGWAHVPILYRDNASYKVGNGAPARPAAMPASDPVLTAFRNGKDLEATSIVTELDGPLRRDIKLTGDGFTTRISRFAGVPAWRVQHNMLVPNPNIDTTDLGVAIACDKGPVYSNLGDAAEGYNRAPNGPWDGWVASRGIFVSVRQAREKFPRGFKVANGVIKLYQHFENGARVRPGDASYERIAELRYLHQGKLNTYMPEVYLLALKNDPRIKAEDYERPPEHQREYPHLGLSTTLDLLVVKYNELENHGTNDFKAWHQLHQRGPVVSLVEVPGMKGKDFPEIEASIKRNLCELPLEFQGQFVFGDFATTPGSLHRVRTPNHYLHVSTTWKNFLRTRDQDFLKRAREFHGYWRDCACLYGKFSHGKGILPWYEISDGHWSDPQGLLLAWQVDGDRLALDKFNAWEPPKATVYGEAIRDYKNVLVQAQYRAEYLGQEQPNLKPLRESIEAVPLEKHGAGWFQQPYWPSKEFAANQVPLNLINPEAFATLQVSVLADNPERHFGWLSRYPIDYPTYQLPGPLGDFHLSMQWGDYLAELRRRGIQKFSVVEEMGDYPMLATRSDWADGATVGLEIVFLKPDGNFSFPFICHAFGGDPQGASIRARLPTGAKGPVILRCRQSGSCRREAAIALGSDRPRFRPLWFSDFYLHRRTRRLL